MAPTSTQYARSYNSFSGVDIKAVMGSKTIAELQAISYSITREKAPIFTMGSADARSYSRGKRGIAGTMVVVMFDRHVMLSNLGGLAPDGGLMFQSDIDDIRPGFVDPNNTLDTALTSLSGRQAGSVVQEQESNLSNVGSDQALATAWYADQIPPFDITLAAANEYGALAVMAVNGVEILNEGYGVSVDDMVSEQQHTYAARATTPWTSVASPNADLIASQGGVSFGS